MIKIFKPKWERMLDKLTDVESYILEEKDESYDINLSTLHMDLQNVTDTFVDLFSAKRK